MAAIVAGRRRLPPVEQTSYSAFVDMSGGSNDDAVLAVAHMDNADRVVLDLCISQTGKPPFNPRDAVRKFAALLQQYNVHRVTGDHYAGETFRADFAEHSIIYQCCDAAKHDLYEALEPKLNAGEVELLDGAELQEQLLTLVWRGRKIDHMPGDHDDFANAAAGAIWLCAGTHHSLAVWAKCASDGSALTPAWAKAGMIYARVYTKGVCTKCRGHSLTTGHRSGNSQISPMTGRVISHKLARRSGSTRQRSGRAISIQFTTTVQHGSTPTWPQYAIRMRKV